MWTITDLQFTRPFSGGFLNLCYFDTFDVSWQLKAWFGDSIFTDNNDYRAIYIKHVFSKKANCSIYFHLYKNI